MEISLANTLQSHHKRSQKVAGWLHGRLSLRFCRENFNSGDFFLAIFHLFEGGYTCDFISRWQRDKIWKNRITCAICKKVVILWKLVKLCRKWSFRISIEILERVLYIVHFVCILITSVCSISPLRCLLSKLLSWSLPSQQFKQSKVVFTLKSKKTRLSPTKMPFGTEKLHLQTSWQKAELVWLTAKQWQGILTRCYHRKDPSMKKR